MDDRMPSRQRAAIALEEWGGTSESFEWYDTFYSLIEAYGEDEIALAVKDNRDRSDA